MSWLSVAAQQVPWSAAGSIIFGAAISATVSYVLQRKSFAEARRQKQADRQEVRKAQALSLVFKLIRISSDLSNLGKAVVESLDRMKKDGFTGGPFQGVVPVHPLPDPVRFTADEMAWVLSVEARLFNDIGPLDELHASTVAIFALYNKKRDAAFEKFGAEMNGMMGTTILTAEQKKWFDPRAAELNQLVEVMLQRSQQDAQEAWAAFEKLTAVVAREFKMKLDFERKPN